MKAIMYAFDQNSESADAVAKGLGLKKIKHGDGSSFQGGPDWVVLNWGASQVPKSVLRSHIINHPQAVAKAINKRAFFQWVGTKARTVPWTTDPQVAKKWLSEGSKVVCRSKIAGYEGQGIHVECPCMPLGSDSGGFLGALATTLAWWETASPEPTSGHTEAFQKAKLWTRFIPNTKEYRVHVFQNEVLAVHRKVEGTGDVKNTANGWKFKKVKIYPEDILAQAIASVKAVGLDFAAVDVVWDGEKAWVLEANTAPGIFEMDWTTKQYVSILKTTIETYQS